MAGLPRACTVERVGDHHVENPIGSAITRGSTMLYWALIFLVVAIIAGIFGFGGVASAATGIAKILFIIFLVVFRVTAVVSLV
jgi:uncharacterized membrane protein YtjA (UPF0391 family)